MRRASLATVRSRLVFEFTDRALGALLLLNVGLISRLAVASAAGQVPLAVPLAEEGGLLDHNGVRHAGADRLLDQRHLAAGRRCGEVREVDRDLRAADVVNFDGKDRDASALVPERKVDALLRHGDRFHLRVYHHLGVRVEPSLACGYAPCGYDTSGLFRQLNRRWISK